MSAEILHTPKQQDEQYGQLLDAFRETSAKDYSDIFEFHPYHHALRVEASANSHLTRLETVGTINDLPSHFSLQYAAIKHDAGLPIFFGVDGFTKLDPNPYECPEALSIDIAKSDGRHMVVDEVTLEEVGNSIWTTKAGVRASSWGGFILCISDIGGAGGDYDSVFLADGDRLRNERILTKGEISVGEYRDFTVWLMSKYIVVNLRGAENFSQDINPSEFFATEIEGIERNVVQLANERSDERKMSLEAYSHDLGDDVPELLRMTECV